MKRRRLGARTLGLIAMAMLSSCVAEPPASTRAVVVRPRVVVDGTVELSDRTGGRVQLSGITAHAASARVVDGDGNVVVDDVDPLFFRFSPTRPEEQLAAERLWALPISGGDLRVGFEPATDRNVAQAPFDAAALTNHTVVITGTIALTPDDGAGGFGTEGEVDPDGTPAIPGDNRAEVDPDGTPAIPGTDGTDGEVDPDGTPAIPGTDGTDGEVDPDGTPAIPGTDGTDGEVDPDGTPAIPGTEGTEGEVDPDGTPAITNDNDRAQGALTAGAKKRRAAQRGLVGRPQLRVPFTLTVDGAFDHRTALSPDDLAAVDAGEVLPVDLRFQASAFFDDDRLLVLERLAAEALADGDEAGAALQVSASTTAKAVRVEANRTVKRVVKAPVAQDTSSRIVVTGPRR